MHLLQDIGQSFQIGTPSDSWIALHLFLLEKYLHVLAFLFDALSLNLPRLSLHKSLGGDGAGERVLDPTVIVPFLTVNFPLDLLPSITTAPPEFMTLKYPKIPSPYSSLNTNLYFES